jgi:hypothetical protein
MRVRYLACMNGWADAPHHWWRYLLTPPHFESQYGRMFVIRCLGFVWWFERVTE